MRVALQQRGGYGGCRRAFYSLLDYSGVVLAPRHAQQSAGAQEVGNAEGDGGRGNFIAIVVFAYLMAHFVAEKHESAIA